VNTVEDNGKTTGDVTIPVSIDQSSTVLLAATIESIDRVGPYQCKLKLLEIADVREDKRKEIGERAKEIMQFWKAQKKSYEAEILDNVHKATTDNKITAYGESALPAGPDIEVSKELVIVEGRADVQLLLSIGIKNIIASNGIDIHKSLVDLSKTKEKVVAFLDGDRVGDMILKSLLRDGAKIDYVARAPLDTEVEDLSPADALSTLQNAEPLRAYLAKQESEKRRTLIPEPLVEKIRNEASNVRERLMSSLLDQNGDRVAEVPVTELYDKLDSYKGTFGLVFDGVVTQRLVDKANNLGIRLIVGERIGSLEKKPEEIIIMRLAEILEQKQPNNQ
jgi:DNA primase